MTTTDISFTTTTPIFTTTSQPGASLSVTQTQQVPALSTSVSQHAHHPNMTQQFPASQPVGLPQIQYNYRSYSLPNFRQDDVQGWFAAVEMVFLEYNVHTEDSKFNKLVTILSPVDFANIRDIIVGNQPNRYTLAKQRLIQIHSQTTQQKVESLLRGTFFPPGTLPSAILRQIRTCVGADIDSETLIRSFWVKYLPHQTQAVLVCVEKEPLDRQAEIADSMARMNPPTENTTTTLVTQPQVAAVSVHPTNALEAKLDSLINSFISYQTSVQSQISAIASSSRNSRDQRTRSPTPTNHRTYRSYNRDKSRNRYTEIFGSLCYFHHKFGNKAKRCYSGCKHFKSESGNDS